METIIWESKRKRDLEDVGSDEAVFWEKKGFSGVNGLFNFPLLNNGLVAWRSDKQPVAPWSSDRPGSPLF